MAIQKKIKDKKVNQPKEEDEIDLDDITVPTTMNPKS